MTEEIINLDDYPDTYPTNQRDFKLFILRGHGIGVFVCNSQADKFKELMESYKLIEWEG
jgi:hypothetical protein